MHIKKLSKGRKALEFIFIILGAALLLWYVAPLPARILNIGNIAGAIFSVMLILFGASLEKIPSPLKTAFCIILCAVVAVCLPLTVNMARYANYKADEGAQTVIVLGCKVRGDKPSKYLYDRCAAAAEYLKENPSACAILSGGQGADEDISEAQCMENVLVEMGIDKRRLYQENRSTSTAENLQLSAEIIENNDLSRDVLIVTNEFHEYRAKLICNRLGLNFHSKSSHSSRYTLLTFYTRELMALVKEIIIN